MIKDLIINSHDSHFFCIINIKQQIETSKFSVKVYTYTKLVFKELLM